MALTYLVDTSVLKRLSNGVVRGVIEPLLNDRLVARARISDLEVGYSARNEDEWLRLQDALGLFEVVDTTSAHLRRALIVQRMLAARSQRGRKIPDLLIAAAAEESGIPVLHYDSDFDLIADTTGQKCVWVAPAGSID